MVAGGAGLPNAEAEGAARERIIKAQLPAGRRGAGVVRWRHAPRERMARPVEVSYLSPERLAERRKDAGLAR